MNAEIRELFPILNVRPGGKPLVYLDSGASTQKPLPVLDAMRTFLTTEYANIHRGVHYLSQAATDAYDAARQTVAHALNARPSEVVFLRGTTEAVNLVAQSMGRTWGEGDEILITVMDHHANIVPWQMLAAEKGVMVRFTPLTPEGDIDEEAFASMLTDRTKLAAFPHVSNVLGTVNPVQRLVAMARAAGALTLVDGAQSVPHHRVDVREIGCDFFVFSGHKMYGPDGIGALYGRREVLEGMPPWQGGGDMIERVTQSKTTFRKPPERFEAGTPHISGAVGLAAAFRFLESVGWDKIAAHEDAILEEARSRLEGVSGVRIVGNPKHVSGVVSFVMDGAHPHDIGTILDTEGVAIRAGHHCAQPLMEYLKITGTARASFGLYNVAEEVDALIAGVEKARRYFN